MSILLRLVIGLAFETVVKIEMIATAPGEKTGEEIGREHERAPAFVLADVDMLVIACMIEALAVLANDHMSQAQR